METPIKDATYMRNLANQANTHYIDVSNVNEQLLEIESAAREGYGSAPLRNLNLDQIKTLQIMGFKVRLANPKGTLHTVDW